MKLRKILAASMAAVMLVSSIFVGDAGSKAEAKNAPKSGLQSILSNGLSNIRTPEKLTEISGTPGGLKGSQKPSYNALLNEKKSVFEILKEQEELNEKFGLKYEGNVTAEDIVRVIITLRGDSVVEYDSKATMDAHTAIRIAALEKAQDRVIDRIEENVLDGETLDVHYQYTWLLNGVAAAVPYGAIDAIREVAGVEDVLLQPYYTPCESAKSDAEISTIYDGIMIGRQPAWETGYTGKGMKIAVIDTGIDEDHQSFGALSEEQLTEDSLTVEKISAVLSQLNASKKLEGVRAEQLFWSTKIAYGFNYVDANLRINHSYDTQGDHGTHVAGIAAANKIAESEVVGVAPDAQLFVMKVFGQNGGAYLEDMLASVEDSMILGADVINMSLGSTAGFTSSAEDVEGIYARVATTNTILAAAAGNSASFGSGNLWDQQFGIPNSLTSNPDNAIVGAPSTLGSALSVGSVENVMLKDVYYLSVAGVPMYYINSQDGNNDSPLVLADQELRYVYVENAGQTLEDFLAADVAGKVAVVSRGVTTFAEKTELAEKAGAIAVIVVNNAAGNLYMSLEDSTSFIPAVSVSRKVGSFLISALQENPEETLVFSSTLGDVENEDGYSMSLFSSWGPAPNLVLKPEISAPGGNIFSCYDGGKYGLMSGTSMATPNIAGIAALVSQYVKEAYPDMKDGEVHAFVNALMMSTAQPLTNLDGVTYSPRLQGAGLANVYDAIMTRAYLLVEGCERPKVELFDDPERTGVYQFTFKIKNFGEEALFYETFANALTESVSLLGLGDDDYLGFISETPTELDAEIILQSSAEFLVYDYSDNGTTGSEDARLLYLTQQAGTVAEGNDAFRYDLDANDASDVEDVQAYLDALVGKSDIDLEKKAVSVPAGEETEVSVSISLSDGDKEYMDYFFENGIYVEGFAGVKALGAGVDLSLPYLAFYGDWTEAPIFDSGYYYQSEDELIANQYYNVLFTNFMGIASGWNPGLNPLVDVPFNHDYISVSPNADGYADYIDDIYVSLLRNAKTLSFTYSNVETGEVYYDIVVDEVGKSTFSAGNDVCLPFIFSLLVDYGMTDHYYFTDNEGNTLPNGTKVKLSIQATLDYDKHASNNKSDTWDTIITVDTEAPAVLDANFVDEDGRKYLDLTFGDNVAVAGITFTDATGMMIFKSEASEQVAAGEIHTQRFDVTGYGNEIGVFLSDYALNEIGFALQTTDNMPKLDASLLYGYRVYDENIMDDSVYAWVSIDPKTGDVVPQNSELYMDYAINAAEYVGGYIYAIGADSVLYAITPGMWNQRTRIAKLDATISDLAFDPVEKKLYGYDKDSWSLVEIDLYSGAVTSVGYPGGNVVAMTCSADGTLYMINDFAELLVYNKDFMMAEYVTSLGDVAGTFAPHYQQSMTYRNEDNCLYWSAYDLLEHGDHGVLVKIDLNEALPVASVAGTVGGNAEIVGLMTLEDDGFVFEEQPAESISLNKTQTTLLPGREEQLTVLKYPWFGTCGELVWSSSDDTVASVEEGLVVANKEGSCTITVSTADGTLSASCEIVVRELGTELNAFILGGSTTKFQWATFDVADMDGFTVSDPSELIFVAADQVDGMLYAYDARSEFYRVDPVTHKAYQIAPAMDDYLVYDMAYDQVSGIMYVLLADSSMGSTYVAPVNLLNGEIDRMNIIPVTDSYYNGICAMSASSQAGVLYMISVEGFLCTLDVSMMMTTTIGLTGFTGSGYNQSMTYDYTENALYWAMVSSVGEVSIVFIDPDTLSAVALGSFDGGVQLTSLYVSGSNLDRDPVAVDSAFWSKDMLVMLEQTTSGLPLDFAPLNTTELPGSWTVEDESIASVDGGIVFAKKPGETVIHGTIGTYELTLPVKVLASAGALYGNVLSDLASQDGDFFGKFSDVDMLHGEIVAPILPNSLYAGAYYDGKVYGYGFNHDDIQSNFYVFDAENGYAQMKAIAGEFPDVMDMAFDYTTGIMYAIAGAKNVDGNSALYQVNLENGDMFRIGDTGFALYGLACTADGVLYAVTSSGDMYTLDKTTGAANYAFSTGIWANQYQSMTYDYNSGNLYWAQTYYNGLAIFATLYCIDLETGSVVVAGKIGDSGCQMTALHTVPATEIPVGTSEIEGVVFGNNHNLVSVGGTLQLKASVYPLAVTNQSKKISFTSVDPSIATVDANGLVSGIAAGTTQIIASVAGIETMFEVKVISAETMLYVGNQNGMQTSPLLLPGSANSLTTFPEAVTMRTMSHCPDDGMVYGITDEGYLYRFTTDFTDFEKVTDMTVFDASGLYVDTMFPEYGSRMFDMTYNAFDGKMYVLYFDANMFSNAIGVIDLETGVITYLMSVMDVARPSEMVFSDYGTAIVYDNIDDYIYRVDIYRGMCQKIIFAQSVVVADEVHAGMYYSTELDAIFFATVDTYYDNSGAALYLINVENGAIEKFGDAAYNSKLIDIFMLEASMMLQ